MHIPDGFLDLKTASAAAALSAGGLTVALRQVRRHLPPRRVPLLGLAAAFVFAAQMLNFPVAGGTSGHLIGGVLAAVLLGPSAAVIALTCVLIVQCLLFADGGVLALGANIFNLAIVGPVAGYGIYRAVRGAFFGMRGMVVAVAFAAWCSTMLAAISCAGQLALSGAAAWSVTFPAMMNVHMLIGIGEGLITALVVVAIARVRPELVDESIRIPFNESYAEVAGFGLLLVLGLAVFVAPVASNWPDGLQKVAASLGFENRAALSSLIPAGLRHYHFPGVGSATWGTALAGGVGTLVVFGLAFVLARALVPKPTAERN